VQPLIVCSCFLPFFFCWPLARALSSLDVFSIVQEKGYIPRPSGSPSLTPTLPIPYSLLLLLFCVTFAPDQILVLQRLESDYVVKLKKVFRSKTKIYLGMSYAINWSVDLWS
jgi:hypothetical protein